MTDRSGRSCWRALVLGALLLIGRTAAAQETQEPPSPGFLIQTIAVEGTKRAASQGIIVAETLLEPGRTYTERELREAVYRVKRLPFVVHAEFSLRKGTERDTYELVITVNETRPFFFAVDHNIFTSPDDSAMEALGYGSGGWSLNFNGLVGARLFLGSKGVAFASFSGQEGFQVGYTQYDLFGTGSVVGLSVARNACCPREVLPLGLAPELVTLVTLESTQAAGSLAVPLGGNHSLRAEARWQEGDLSGIHPLLLLPEHSAGVGFGEPMSHGELEVKWFYDTADDPLFPGRGVTFSAGLEASDLETSLATFDILNPEDAGKSKARLFALAATGRRNWSLGSRQVFSAGLRAAVGHSQIENLVLRGGFVRKVDLDSMETSANLRYSVSLWGPLRTREQGDLRLELRGSYGYESVSPDIGAGSATHYLLSTGVVFRNGWGVFRGSFSYLDYEGAQ